MKWIEMNNLAKITMYIELFSRWKNNDIEMELENAGHFGHRHR